MISREQTNWYSSLVPILEEIYNTKITVSPGFLNTVRLATEELQLYISVMPKTWLTISVIGVGEKRQRQGIGTTILQWCKQYCKENDIPIIKMESAVTKEVHSFCLKHGFQLAYPQDDLGFDYVLKCTPNDKLQSTL